MDKREQARVMYEKGDKYKDISSFLDVPMNTLKSWRKRHGWKRGGATKEVQPSSRGAPLNNKNAEGNKGNRNASPPVGNKNAVVTGQYEKLMFGHLNEDEQGLLLSGVDSELVLVRDIQLLRVRQARMMKRLESAEKGLNDHEKTTLYELRARQALIEAKGKKMTVDKGEELIKTEEQVKTTPRIDIVLRIEKALNDVSAQLARSVKQFNESQLLENKKELMSQQIEKIKAEIEVLRGSKEGNADATDWKAALAEAEKELAEMGELDGD